MNQDKPETKSERSSVEDLTVNDEQAGEVRGGTQFDVFRDLKGIDGESSDDRHR